LNQSVVFRQKIGALFSIFSAILLVLVMFFYQAFAMKGVSGVDVYEKTVNSMNAHPIINWALMLIGVAAIILFFWTVEAVEERLRKVYQEMSSNVSRFAYFYLFLYALYMLFPAAVLHDLANSDLNVSEALETVHPIIEISLVLSALSSIFLGIWMVQVGVLVLKTKVFCKVFGIFTLAMSGVVIFSGAYEALYGRGGVVGIISSILSFLGAFVIWKIWLGIAMLRRPIITE
jgi:hypothetical protein